jgi:hypothetical protein
MTYIANILTINYLTRIVISVKILGIKFLPYIAEICNSEIVQNYTIYSKHGIIFVFLKLHEDP